MKVAMVCLLEVLRGNADARGYTSQQLEEAFALAEAHKVLPLFLTKLRESKVALADEFERRCQDAEREMTVSTFWWTSEILGILKALDAAGVAVILLKGLSMAERLYGSASLLPSRDIDLLVRQDQLAVAGEILSSLDFVRGDHENEDRHQTWRRNATMVELHYDLASRADLRFDMDRVFANARRVTFAEQPAYVLSSADELLFLCIHGIKHCYEQLSHVLDVAYASRDLPQRPLFAVCPSDARFVDPIVALGCALAEEASERQPSIELHLKAATAARVRRAADMLWLQLVEAEESEHIRFPRQLYLALRPDWLSRWRYAWHISTAVRDEDRELGGKLHIRDERLIFVLRPLRLLARRLFAKT